MYQESYEIKCEYVKLKKIIIKKNSQVKSLEFEKNNLNDKLIANESKKKLIWLIRNNENNNRFEKIKILKPEYYSVYFF